MLSRVTDSFVEVEDFVRNQTDNYLAGITVQVTVWNYSHQYCNVITFKESHCSLNKPSLKKFRTFFVVEIKVKGFKNKSKERQQ